MSASSPIQPPATSSFAATVDVETPELVVFSYTVAGVASRAWAALIDYLLCFTIFLGLIILAGSLGAGRVFLGRGGTPSEALVLSVMILGQFFVLWGYYLLFEALWDGQTPGKRAQQIRVVRDGGYSVDFAASAIRNLIRIVDMQPIFTYGFGIASVLMTKSGKRLGDLAAGTIVVREEIVRQDSEPRYSAPVAATGVPAPLHTALTDEEYALLGRFLERRRTLQPNRQRTFAEQLAERFAAALAPIAEGLPLLERLHRLHASEAATRAAGVGARKAVGAARERHAIIARGSPRWNAFASRLAKAQSSGLKGLGEHGLRDFVAEYRELAADLARLRTASAGGSAPEVFYLSRLVAGAHNLLYRGRSLTIWQVIRFVVRDAPAEVIRSWRPVLLAVLLFFGPMAIAYTAVIRHPESARIFIPDAMIDRAERGVDRAKNEEGYIPDPQAFRPVMATGIIANNVQVAFFAFAGGITGGLLTLWLLVANGISIGGVLALYVTHGIGSLILAFVAPHSVFELSAICIAGGAGLLLGSSLFVPGQRTRRQALTESGRRAIRLVGAATFLLVMAGLLEGLVSPIPWWPLEWKVAVGVLAAIVLYVYLRPPRRASAPAPDEAAEAPADLLTLTAPRAP